MTTIPDIDVGNYFSNTTLRSNPHFVLKHLINLLYIQNPVYCQ